MFASVHVILGINILKYAQSLFVFVGQGVPARAHNMGKNVKDPNLHGLGFMLL